MTNFSSLPNQTKVYLDQRFDAYGLDTELAYDQLIPTEVKIQGPEAIENFMQKKHISHVYPVSQFPHLSDNFDNIFLEDPAENMMRGANIATSDEIENAYLDNYTDSFDHDFNDNGLIDSYEELLGF